AGVAPESASKVVEQHARRVERAAESARRVLGHGGQRVSRPPGDIVYFPGCTGCATTADDVRKQVDALEVLLDTTVRVVTDRCCGLPLLDAGHPEGFAASMGALAEATENAARIVVGDPGCLHAMVAIAPRFGVHFGTELEHFSQAVVAPLTRRSLPAEARTYWYHDPCRLGRGLGIYDEPRRILETLTGQKPHEFREHHDQAGCSGAGAQLPRTHPETAQAIAKERTREPGSAPIVTTCPGSKRAFEKAGAKVFDLGALVHDRLFP
ncbi:MAG: (Fe-S)-binding protein, partial [Myxococcales bacterium]|nr:(Fe-S)-binding protein [Myxococcales bacterium]